MKIQFPKASQSLWGKKQTKKERPELAGELRILTQMSYGEKSIANPEGPERDNDLQLPAALFPISDKRKNGMGVKRKRLSRGRRRGKKMGEKRQEIVK